MRRATDGRSIYFTWSDGTWVQGWFTAKGPMKSSVAVQHGKLATKDDADRVKQFWGERLDALGALLSVS